MERFQKLISSRTYRYKEGSIVVPGIVAIKSCKPEGIKSIITCSKSSVETLQAENAIPQSAPIHLLTKRKMGELTNEKSPDAIVAEADLPKMEEFKSSLFSEGVKRILAINGLRDGANMGLLVRSVGCLKWDGVVIMGEGNVDPFNIQTIRASTGAVFKVPIYKAASFEVFNSDDTNNGEVQIVFGEIPEKTENTPDAVGSEMLDFGKPIVLVIGGEKDGHKIQPTPSSTNPFYYMSIPVEPSFGSLNAACSGAIMMSSINQNISKFN
jgi:TrmH family RNA methyltransferase